MLTIQDDERAEKARGKACGEIMNELERVSGLDGGEVAKAIAYALLANEGSVDDEAFDAAMKAFDRFILDVNFWALMLGGHITMRFKDDLPEEMRLSKLATMMKEAGLSLKAKDGNGIRRLLGFLTESQGSFEPPDHESEV